jgi:acetylornithine deacetylase/succinyl-diaminopimelate desuccinylase-like protein
MNLEETVRFLAADEMQGRGPGNPRAAEWIFEKFKEYGLEASKHEFDFNLEVGRVIKGINVVGRIAGTSDETIVIGAHHDHLGVKEGHIYNGADDNASGVAALLECARQLARTRPTRTLLFVSFDLEERGMVGSSKFVNTLDTSKVAAMVCLDLVGGHFFKGEEKILYVLGSEYSREVEEVVRQTGVAELDVVKMGIFVMEPMGPNFARSDYMPFRRKGVPFVFLSTGTPWYYHTIHDDVERIDFPKLERVTRYLCQLTSRLAESPRPKFVPNPPPTVADAKVMVEKLDAILAWPNLGERTRDALGTYRTKIQEAVEAGQVGEAARQAMQAAMVNVFQLVGRTRP